MTSNCPDPRSRLFVALDVPDVARASALVEQIGAEVLCYKVGLELLFGGGLGFAQGLKAAGKDVFLDMKLLDIPNTVEKAAANIAALGLDYLTVHGTDRKTLDAAVRGRGTSSLKLLAVTVLTSLDTADLREQGITDDTPSALVVRRARLAQAAGFDGVWSLPRPFDCGRRGQRVERRVALALERSKVCRGDRLSGWKFPVWA